METGKRSVVASDEGEGGMNGGSTGDVESSDTILYDTVMADTCHYAFVQTHRMNNTKREPSCKRWTL